MQAAEDDGQEYQRLLHFMTRPGPRFAMALARYRDATVARSLRDRLIVEAASRECRAAVLELLGADAAVDIVARLEAASGHGDARIDVLFVVGLESLLVDPLGGLRHTPAISNLNQRRDRLPELLDARVVWWIGEWAYAAYATELRDLSEVMHTSVQFPGRVETFVEPGRSASLPGWMAHVQPEQHAAMTEQAVRLERLHARASDLVERAELASSVAQLWASLGEREPTCIWFVRSADEFEQTGMLERAAQQARQYAVALLFWGEVDLAQAQAERALDLARRAGNTREELETLMVEVEIARTHGRYDHALGLLRDVIVPGNERLGDARERAVAMGKVAAILQARGELDEALRIHRDEELPVFERLGDVRSRAVTMGEIANILRARGELDEALRIHRDEALPVFERLGDVRSRAFTMGQIADILQARGELDEALRIHRDEALPVFERLGDVRSRAFTMGKIADIVKSKGDPDEALRIRRDEQLPVYDRLGDVRERAVTMGKIADILQARGEFDEALRIIREEEFPVYERLGEVHSLLVARTNLASTLAMRGRPNDVAECVALLAAALRDARRLGIPDVATIADVVRWCGFDPSAPPFT